MKKTTLLLSLAMLVLIISCKKEPPECNLVPVKILRYDCDRIIFQLPDTMGLGDANWTDVKTGISYNNVAYSLNNCGISVLTNCEKITVYARLEQPGNPPQVECFQCQAISENPPGTMNNLSDISLTGCQSAEQ